MRSDRSFRVFKIEEGTVIDHIPSPLGLLVLDILGHKNEGIISIGLNFDSRQVGKKDLIKFEHKVIRKEETDKIALVAPQATINIIQDGKVVKKRDIDVPDSIEGFLTCMNPNCITNQEKVKTAFDVIDKEKIKVKCRYCERVWEVKPNMIEKDVH